MATAEILAREGCDLAITARSEDGVKDAVANLKKYGTKVFGSAVNVKKEDAYKAWLATSDRSSLKVAISLIPITSASGGTGSEKYWHNAFEVDVLGPVRAVEAVLPVMTERQTGSIVLIGTTSAGEAMGGPQAYNAMKAALITWGKQLALAHGKDGIRVNVVSPGPVEFEGGNWDMIKGTMEKFYASPRCVSSHPAALARPRKSPVPSRSWQVRPQAGAMVRTLVVDGGYTNRTHF